MKKYLSIIASAMLLCFTGCSEEECTHRQECDVCHKDPCVCEKPITGSWYIESENEEIRYAENGIYYGRYANYERCAYNEGRWEYDAKNKRLTYRYSLLGQTQFVDWTVKNLTAYGFTITSDKNGSHVLEKIVESYEMKVGETRIIQFGKDNADFQHASYSSNNERIATVTADGTITAQGEKGITYITVSSGLTNVWVKVTVGDNCADMWYDYVGLIGLDYSNMRKALSRLGDPYSGEDGYSFGFIHQVHEVADVTKVFICPECGIVTQIQLLIKESVPEAEILSYMNSRYYKFVENGPYVFYSSVEDKEASKAIVAYNKSEKCVIFNEAQHFLHYPHVKDLWADFVPLFGSDKDQVKSKMAEYGYSFLVSDYNYSKDGSDYYNITNNAYAQMVGFVFNPDNQVSEFWVYMNPEQDPNEIYSYLSKKYTRYEDEETEENVVFYNEDKKLRVVFDLVNGAVVYTDLTLSQHQTPPNDLWPDLSAYLDKTAAQLKNELGNPYAESEKQLIYLVSDNYLSAVSFGLNSETGVVNAVISTIKQDADIDRMHDFLKQKYFVYEKGTIEAESYYAFKNKENTLGVILDKINRWIGYYRLSDSPSKVKSFGISSSQFGNDNEELINVLTGIRKKAADTKRNLK